MSGGSGIAGACKNLDFSGWFLRLQFVADDATATCQTDVSL
jgi:hypothetical protein